MNQLESSMQAPQEWLQKMYSINQKQKEELEALKNQLDYLIEGKRQIEAKGPHISVIEHEQQMEDLRLLV